MDSTLNPNGPKVTFGNVNLALFSNEAPYTFGVATQDDVGNWSARGNLVSYNDQDSFEADVVAKGGKEGYVQWLITVVNTFMAYLFGPSPAAETATDNTVTTIDTPVEMVSVETQAEPEVAPVEVVEEVLVTSDVVVLTTEEVAVLTTDAVVAISTDQVEVLTPPDVDAITADEVLTTVVEEAVEEVAEVIESVFEEVVSIFENLVFSIENSLPVLGFAKTQEEAPVVVEVPSDVQ